MPNQQNFETHICELISTGKLKQALAELTTWADDNADTETHNRVTLLSARYATNENKNNFNEITGNDYSVETSKITKATLAVLDNITFETSNKPKHSPADTIPTQHAQNIYNNVTHISGSKNVNTGNIKANNVTIGDSNNAENQTPVTKNTGWWIGIGSGVVALIALLANIGTIKDSFFKKEEPKVIAAPPVITNRVELQPLEKIRAEREKRLKAEKEELLPNLDSVIAERERNKNRKPIILKGIPYDVKTGKINIKDPR